jgi:hypothetical protein
MDKARVVAEEEDKVVVGGLNNTTVEHTYTIYKTLSSIEHHPCKRSLQYYIHILMKKTTK